MAEIDWKKSMQQTFEFYKVDPLTWLDEEKIQTIKSCTINRDSSDETLGSATFDGDEMEGEFYIRVYLIAVQNGRKYKEPLGTYLVQTSISSFTGKQNKLQIEAYTPLIELKEKCPPIGFTVLKGETILSRACRLTRDNVRAPIVENSSSTKTVEIQTGFVSELSETWLTYLTALLSTIGMHYDIDPMGRILFPPDRDDVSMSPVFTYDDGNSSILYPEITTDYDLYNVPNVVEVILSNEVGHYTERIENNEYTSPISTVNRGRVVLYRVENPEDLKTTSFSTAIGRTYIKEYARKLLKTLSTIEHTLTYKHGYCPVRVGDCVRLNYKRAGLMMIDAVVKSQSIQCIPGCPVTETAVYTERLWG